MSGNLIFTVCDVLHKLWIVADLGQLEVEEVEKEMETARIEESMKEAEAQNGGHIEEALDETPIIPPEAEGEKSCPQ